MKLIVVNKSKELNFRRLEAFFVKLQKQLLKKRLRNKKLLRLKTEVTLVFLQKSEMKKINFKFRKKNKPTDVLSFHSGDPKSLGELLFCLDVLKMQAREQRHSLEQEFLYMLTHGLLHLLGYDHELSKAEELRMFRLQDQCFKKLNEG